MSPQTPQSLAAKRSKRTHRLPKRLLDDDFFPGDLTLPIARIVKTTSSETPPPAKKDETTRVVDQDSVAENVEVDASLVTTRSNKAPAKETGDETNVIKKGSPFHPSITLSNGLRISKTTGNATTISSPLIEKPSTPTNIAKQVASTPSSPKHKKPKGFSLMVKQSPLNQNQTQNSQQQIQQQQQQTKYYNNFSQNLQYGTRLLLNEPIYLPRSVATIAPITTTLQQVASLYRDSLSITEPVFGQTKKAEAFLSYQKEGGLNYMTSYHTAIMKITKYLQVTDLLNLRLANKTWKSIVDNDEVWRKVVLKSCRIVDWKQFETNILSRHSTWELTFVDIDKGCIRNLERVIIKGGYNLKKLNFITKDMNGNQNVLAFLKKLYGFKLQTYEPKFTIRYRWDVKVEINSRGRAYVRLSDGINQEGVTMEFSDIEEKLNRRWIEPFVEMRMF